MIKYILLFLIVCFQACSQKTIGYFEVAPYAKVKSNRIDQPLYIRISNRISDKFVIQQIGFKLEVNDFYKTLFFANSRAFSDLFSEVKWYEAQKTGFFLDLQRMEASFINESKKDDASFDEIYCVINYASTIYRGDEMVSQAEGSVKVKYGDNEIYSVEQLYKEAVKQSISAMAQQHYNNF